MLDILTLTFGILITMAGLYTLYEAAMTLNARHFSVLISSARNKIVLPRLITAALGWFLLLYGGIYNHLWLLPLDWVNDEGIPVKEAMSSLFAAGGTWYTLHHLAVNAAKVKENQPNPLKEMNDRLVDTLKAQGYKVTERKSGNDERMTATFKSKPQTD